MLFYALFTGSKLTVLAIKEELHQTAMLLAKDLAADLTMMPPIEEAKLFLAFVAVRWGLVRDPLWTWRLIYISFWIDHLTAHIMLIPHQRLLLIWAVIERNVYKFSIDWEVIVLERRGNFIGIILFVLNGKRVVLRTAKLLFYRLIDKFGSIWWSPHHVLRHVYIVPEGRPTRSFVVRILSSLFIKFKCVFITFRRGREHFI